MFLADEFDRYKNKTDCLLQQDLRGLKGILCALAVVVPSIVRKTKAFLASRDYRRSKKVRKSALAEAKAIKTPRKSKRKGTEELLARLREA